MARVRANMSTLKAMAVTMAALLCTSPCAADAGLSILHVGPANGPFPQGQHVQVKVRMSAIPPTNPAAGFQAFLEFDSSRLAFVSGTYPAVPFGLPITTPIVAVGNQVNLASGINPFIGQTATSADSDLAILTFQITTSCGMGAVEFRPNLPPSRLSNASGLPIEPLVLNDLSLINTCPGDVVSSNDVNVADLLFVIVNWGACPPSPTCCPGNTNGDAMVNVADLLTVIVGWGPCP